MVPGSKSVLGRIKVSDLVDLKLDQLQIMLDASTSAEEEAWARVGLAAKDVILKPIFSPANSEISLQYSRALGVWYAMEVDSVTAQLVLWTAKKPTGPWTSAVLYNIAAPFDDLTKYRSVTLLRLT